MLEFDLDEKVGIAILKPHGALMRTDFSALSQTVDHYIEKTGVLPGLLIDASAFPGWDGFDAFRAHVAFIENHHMKVARVAVVSDSAIVSLFPAIADFFLQSEVKLFHNSDTALAWLLA